VLHRRSGGRIHNRFRIRGGTSMARRHRATPLAVLAAAVLAVPIITGCSAIDTALDCAETAVTIADSVDDLQQAVGDAADNPAEARRALDQIEKNLEDLGDKTGNTDMSKAVDALDGAVENVRKAIDEGTTPDLGPVHSAASELTKVCSPG
jgi:hypothetical protein